MATGKSTSWKPGAPVLLRTSGLLLRSIRPRDVNVTYTNWWNDLEINPHAAGRRRVSPADMRLHVAKFDNRQRFHLGIFPGKGKKMVGYGEIILFPNRLACRGDIRIGNKAMWRQGIASAAARAMIGFIFDILGLHRIEFTYAGENAANKGLLEKLGFRHEGTLREEIRGQGGRRIDLEVYGLLRTDRDHPLPSAHTD